MCVCVLNNQHSLHILHNLASFYRDRFRRRALGRLAFTPSDDTLASEYGTFLATLNAQKSSLKINSVNKKKFCQNCKKYGHRTKDCDDFDDSEQNENDASQKDAHTSKRMHCDFCDKDGHTELHCHFKKRFNAKLKQIQEEEAAAEGACMQQPREAGRSRLRERA